MRGIAFSVAMGLVSASQVGVAEARVVEQLERGAVVLEQQGGGFALQALLDYDPEKFADVLNKDFNGLKEIFPNIAFVQPYKTADNLKLLYIKLRNLGDGLGVWMQVKSGGDEAFKEAPELPKMANQFRLSPRVNAPIISTVDDLNTEISQKNTKSGERRESKRLSRIVLDGPLNNVVQMPNVRMVIHLDVHSYIKAKDGVFFKAKFSEVKPEGVLWKTHLVAHLVTTSSTPGSELGDYKGFGDRRLNLASYLGRDLFRSLQIRTASLAK